MYKNNIFLAMNFRPALGFNEDVAALCTNHCSPSSVYVKKVLLFIYMLPIFTSVSQRFTERENFTLNNPFS
jgi:hypothetical protein